LAQAVRSTDEESLGAIRRDPKVNPATAQKPEAAGQAVEPSTPTGFDANTFDILRVSSAKQSHAPAASELCD
jgi:hypothetical protein